MSRKVSQPPCRFHVMIKGFTLDLDTWIILGVSGVVILGVSGVVIG